MFEQELQYFIDNQDELVRKHGGRTLLLKGQEVVGVYDTPLAAYLDAQNRYDPGTYMIQKCEAGEDAYTITLSSARVGGEMLVGKTAIQ